MKKLAIVLIVGFASTFLMSCDELFSEMGINFASDYYETEFIIPATDAGEFMVVEEVVTDDLEAMLIENGYDVESIINYVQVKNIVFEVTEDSPVTDFSAIDIIESYLYSDALAETKIALDTNNGAAVTSINLDAVSNDVADYLKEDKVFCVGMAYLNKPLEAELKIKVKVQFTVNIQAMEAVEGTTED